jgi:hypothetical protein
MRRRWTVCSQGRSLAKEGNAGRESHQSGTRHRWNLCRFGRNKVIRMTWQAIQGGIMEVASAKHGTHCSIRRSGLQVPLPAEGVHATCEPKGHHGRRCIDTVSRPPGALVRTLGRRASAMGLTCVHELRHVVCCGDVNFVGVCSRDEPIPPPPPSFIRGFHAVEMRRVQWSPVQYCHLV